MCSMPSRVRHPLDRLVRWRMVAKVDSMGFVASDALPVLGREVEEGQQFFSVFLEAESGFRILRLIGFNEQVESVHARWSVESYCQKWCLED